MKSPELGIWRPLTREELLASFKPCPICGEIEKETTWGVYRITHNYSKHFDDWANELRREA